MTQPAAQPPKDYYFPSSFLYSAGHLWASVEDLRATIGLTEFVFDLVNREYFFVQLPTVGITVLRGEVLGALDALKVAIPILSPLSGTVVEVNPEIARDPRLPMSSPYSRGWLLRLDLSEPIELRRLMRLPDYKTFIASSESLDFAKHKN